METLAEHDAQRMEWQRQTDELNNPHPNGIACPKCGKELWDSNPGITLTSCPARKNVNCPACDYAGSRIA